MSSAFCPHCAAPRAEAPECPRCGVVFAKLDAMAARDVALSPDRPPHLPAESAGWSGPLDDARLELRLRIFAVPGALAFFWLLFRSPTLHMLTRTFLSMWVHEAGHAVSAWFCGHWAFPGPWRTPIGETRSFFVVVLLLGALGWWGARAFQQRRFAIVAVAGALVITQVALTIGLDHQRAFELFTFAGDGGSFVLGALLVSTFYLPAEHPLRREWLRWGFLVIGAAAMVDAFSTWWSARTDFDAIPFGQIEGVGLSDPSKLTELYHWSFHQLVNRYLALGFGCLAALTVLYFSGLAWARRALREAEGARP